MTDQLQTSKSPVGGRASVEVLQNASIDAPILAQVVDSSSVNNAQFLSALFQDIADGEFCWSCFFPGNPETEGKWFGSATLPANCRDVPAQNAYFSVAAVKRNDQELKRRKGNFSRLFVVPLDDCEGINLPPTYKIETSRDNFQTGFRLSVPVSDLRLVDWLFKGLPSKSNVRQSHYMTSTKLSN